MSLSQRIPAFVKKSAERVVQATEAMKADPGQSMSRMLKPTVTAVAISATLAGSATLSSASATAAASSSQPNLNSVYMVRRGDTLSHISPSAWHTVATENHIANPDRIFIGQMLYVDVKQVVVRLRPMLMSRAQFNYLQQAHIHSRGYRPAPAVQPSKPVSKPTPKPKPISHPPTNSTGNNSHPPTSGGGFQGNAINFCHAAVDWSNMSQWKVPNSCYGTIYYPNPANFPSRPSWGWCNWAAEESHTNYGGYSVLGLTKHWDAPRVGAVVWFNGGVQGAGGDGHWANLVAIGPNGWGLVEEMNFYWRGGGWAKLDYRYIRLYAPGVAYLYA